MKQIQIDESLFYDMCRLAIAINEDVIKLPPELQELHQRVMNGLTNKVQKIADRELYTAYKTAQTAEERENARQAYLDSKGIPKDFRW